MPKYSIPSFTKCAKSPAFLAGNMESVQKSAWLLRKCSWKERRFLGWAGLPEGGVSPSLWPHWREVGTRRSSCGSWCVERRVSSVAGKMPSKCESAGTAAAAPRAPGSLIQGLLRVWQMHTDPSSGHTGREAPRENKAKDSGQGRNLPKTAGARRPDSRSQTRRDKEDHVYFMFPSILYLRRVKKGKII